VQNVALLRCLSGAQHASLRRFFLPHCIMAETALFEKNIRKLRLVSEALELGKLAAVRRMLNTLSPSEIANLLESLPQRERLVAWGLVDSEDDGEVLVHVAEEVRQSLIRDMDREEILAAAESLDLDDLADLLEDLPAQITEEVLKGMDRDNRERLERVLSYPEDTAGRSMNPDVVTIRPDVSVDVVLRYLRMRAELPDHTDHLYVINRRGHYIGRLAITALITQNPEAPIAELIDESQPAIHAETSMSEVAAEFENRRYISAPIVDAQNVLIGRITVDDVLDIVRDEAEHSVMSMAGMNEEEDMFAPIWSASKRRALWLGINLVTAFLAAWVIGQFEATLEQVVALAVLMPVVASMGGIAGTQTLTLIVRGLALGQVSWDNAKTLLRRELLISALNGLLWASVVALVAQLWFQDAKISLIIASAIAINLLTAAFSGVLIPLLLKRFAIDPALAGGVVLTTVTDCVGFLAFLGLATLVLF
jgi:magnesium transporter